MNLCRRCISCCKFSCYPQAPDDDEPKAQLVLQNPFIGVSEKRYLTGNDFMEIDFYQAVNVVAQKPQIDFSSRTEYFPDDELPSSEDSDDFNPANASKLLHARSLDNLIVTPPSPQTSGRFTKCQSLTTLFTDTSNIPTCTNVTLDYAENDEILTIVINDICNLPPKGQYTTIYFTLKILPSLKEGLLSKMSVSCINAVFNEVFRIKNMSLQNLKRSTFRLAVFNKDTRKRGSTSKDTFICEGFLKGSDVNWSSTHTEEVQVFLKRKWLKKFSTSNKYLESDLGELFVLLEYRPIANRMKVLVRKANNLPKSDKLIGHPGHSVLINLRKGDEVIACHETRVQGGLNAVWNQPFLFTIPNQDTDSYFLEFIVMRNRRYTKDDVVGHVIIGSDGPKSGIDHWTETMKPRGLECALWHDIVPIFRYKE